MYIKIKGQLKRLLCFGPARPLPLLSWTALLRPYRPFKGSSSSSIVFSYHLQPSNLLYDSSPSSILQLEARL